MRSPSTWPTGRWVGPLCSVAGGSKVSPRWLSLSPTPWGSGISEAPPLFAPAGLCAELLARGGADVLATGALHLADLGLALADGVVQLALDAVGLGPSGLGVVRAGGAALVRREVDIAGVDRSARIRVRAHRCGLHRHRAWGS